LSQATHSAGNPLRQLLYAVLLYTSGAAAIHAAPSTAIVLPALTHPASGEHHSGKVVWTDLSTPDLEAAKRFYGALLGWTFKDVPGDSNYMLALLNGEPVAGLFQKALPPGQSQQSAWLTFLAVRNVDTAQQAALQHGGKVLAQPHTYRQQEIDFYKTLFGYNVYDLATDGGADADAQHYIFSSDDYARAGLNVLAADSMRRRPHWLNFVRVTDAADTAKKAVTLGGRVLVEPRMDRHGGQLAVLADPGGAPFGVMEWSDTDTKQEPQ